MKIKITSAKFIKGIIGTDDILKDDLLQIAFVGRSNVGKSSVINSLVNQKNLVKSSATPGKTQQINFFRIDAKKDEERMKAYFVDLPGYGFAKLSEKRREKLRKLILWYLADSGVRPQKIALIIDAKVGPTQFDIEMLGLLKANSYDVVVIANKADKLKRNDRLKQLSNIAQKLDNKNIILHSAKTKEGREEVLKEIFSK
jgi:GTP-binding protein